MEPMIQSITLHRARLPLTLLVALAALALAAVLATRLSLSATSVADTQYTAVVAPSSTTVQTVRTQPVGNMTNCDHGAYVTGDMAGDASPAAIYDSLCASH
jgi:hypothetical protein